MNPLQLTLSFEPGGRREAISTLARGLAFEGVPCDLACIEQLGCESGIVDRLFGRVQALQRRQVGSRRAVARLVQLCDERQINLIHAHDAASQWLAARVRLARPNIKLLMTFHRSLGFESAGWKSKIRNAAAGLATAAVVVGSRERRAHYLCENYVPRAKVVRIPFGINLSRFQHNAEARGAIRRDLGVQDDELLIGAVGHFGAEKGIDLAIHAFLALRGRVPARMVVVGRGDPEQDKMVRKLAEPASDAILFAGFRSNVEQYFAAMDVFLHLPRVEAFGLVVAEAMACGVPVVGAAVGGVPDMVREGSTGLLVPSENPDAAAAALVQLVENTVLRARLADGAAQVASREYTENQYAHRHLELYQKILSGVAPTGVEDELTSNELQTNGRRWLAASVSAEERCNV